MKAAMKPANIARFLAYVASAMALSSPALATEIRYAGQLDSLSASATQPLFSAITMGGASEPTTAFLARFTHGGQLIQASRQVFMLEALSVMNLQNVVLNQACELQGAGPCLVNESSQTLAIGVRRNSDGTADVLQGNFIENYGKKAVRLSKVSDALSALGGGASIIYSRAQPIAPAAPNPDDIYQNEPQSPIVYQPAQPSRPPVAHVPTPAQYNDEHHLGYCSIKATMKGHSFHLGVGFTEATGNGTILCKYDDAPDERLPVKIVTQGLGIGAGLTWNTRFHLLATGIGITTRGARGLLGSYGISTTGGHLLLVGGELGLGFTAHRGGVAIPFGIRGKTGAGLELSTDLSGMTIMEDDGTPALLPSRENSWQDHHSHN